MQNILSKAYLAPYRQQILSRIRQDHIRTVSAHQGRLFLISTTYPGYWLEHLYDPIVWANLFPEDKDICISQLRLFLENQREDGMLPSYILDNDFMQTLPSQVAKAYTGLDHCPSGISVYHRLIQECVSVATLCLEIWELDRSQDLSWYYSCCCKWDRWLCSNRMRQRKGLVEVYCGYETGHDNSARFYGIKCPQDLCDQPMAYQDGRLPECDVAPLICPDVNAVFYGNRMSLSKMASLLGKTEEAAEWARKAEQVKKLIFEHCFDEKECFFFDENRWGEKIKVKSISITTLFCEGLLDQALADQIYDRHLADPLEFATAFPFPGLSVSDPEWKQKLPGNDWGYYAQGNVALRTIRWMKRYGREKEMRHMMARWLEAWCRPDIRKFGQELHPVTGEPSKTSQWYSTTMLYLLSAMKELDLE